MSDNLIYKNISAIMAEIAPIAKSRMNEQQKYTFRGIDDIYNEIQPLLVKHGVFTIPKVLEDRHEERTSKYGAALIYRVFKMSYTFYAEDGSSVEAIVIGEGMDTGDKASNKAMAVAHKYALLQTFSIPTADAKDPENDSQEIKIEQSPKEIVLNRIKKVLDKHDASEDARNKAHEQVANILKTKMKDDSKVAQLWGIANNLEAELEKAEDDFNDDIPWKDDKTSKEKRDVPESDTVLDKAVDAYEKAQKKLLEDIY